MDTKKDLLVKDLEKQNTKEDIEKFVEDAVLLGHEDVAELGREKIAQLEAFASSAQEIGGSKIIQIEEQGGSKEEISKRTEGFNQDIDEVKKLAENEVKEINAIPVEDLKNENAVEVKKSFEEVEKETLAVVESIFNEENLKSLELEDKVKNFNGTEEDYYKIRGDLQTSQWSLSPLNTNDPHQYESHRNANTLYKKLFSFSEVAWENNKYDVFLNLQNEVSEKNVLVHQRAKNLIDVLDKKFSKLKK